MKDTEGSIPGKARSAQGTGYADRRESRNGINERVIKRSRGVYVKLCYIRSASAKSKISSILEWLMLQRVNTCLLSESGR